MEIFSDGTWLPLAFAGLMALALLVYAVLDGYDIGVGLLMLRAKPEERDVMIASIGPFWDANETWLVLAIGLLLVAFPEANGFVLTSLYLPTAFMLFGLCLRGVSFDFRAKAKVNHKAFWDRVFSFGSFLMAFAQGYMLASYTIGFAHGLYAKLFDGAVGLCVAAAYGLIGASWLIMKTEGDLQKKAIHWAKFCLFGTTGAIVLVSVATPLVSPRVYERWLSEPTVYAMALLPIVVAVLIGLTFYILNRLPKAQDRGCWKPFALTVGIFLMCLIGLGYSFYPYIVPDRIKIVDGASAPESLMFILVGALIVLPFMIGYTFFAYKIFHGKTKELAYY